MTSQFMKIRPLLDKKIIAVWLVCISLLLLSTGSYAAKNLHFFNLKIKGVGITLDMAQDHQGFIWMATDSGLFRYDGYQYRHFRHQRNDSTSLPNDKVMSLLVDGQHRLWAATAAGLALFDPTTNAFTTYYPDDSQGDSKKNRQIRKIVADGKGGIWLATRQGVQNFDPKTKKFRIYKHDPEQASSLSKDNVDTLVIDQQGGLWAATWPKGIDYLPAGSSQFQHYQISTVDNSPLEKNIRALYVDSQQRLWLGTEAGIFLQQPKQQWSLQKALPVLGGAKQFRVHQFLEDSSGTIWVATASGLLRWDEKKQQFDQNQYQQKDPYSIASNRIYALLEDRSQSFWLSTAEGFSRVDLSLAGFDLLFPQGTLGSAESVGGDVIKTIAMAKEGYLWVGVRSKVLLVDLKTKKTIKEISFNNRIEDKQYNTVGLSLYQQENGTLWVGTRNGLLQSDMAQNNFQLISLGDAGSNSINKITPSNSGTLWLGTGGGLIEYDPKIGVLRHFKHDPDNISSLTSNSISEILVTHDGAVWASGGDVAGGGIDVLNPATEQFQHYFANSGQALSLDSNFVTDLKQDSQGKIWVATMSGLNQVITKADGGVGFKHYDNLLSNSIRAITFDRLGQIWVNSHIEVVKIDPLTGQFKRFFLPDRGSSDWAYGDSLRTTDDSLYFIGGNSLIIINSSGIRHNGVAPDVAITDISVLNRSLSDNTATDGVQLEGGVTNPRHLTLPWKDMIF
ncbi:MAG: hypothetical protein GQ581_03945 [Methyloprofundus sp.]|nr:hypothetical protein [Methyloprofundus sp.]